MAKMITLHGCDAGNKAILVNADSIEWVIPYGAASLVVTSGGEKNQVSESVEQIQGMLEQP